MVPLKWKPVHLVFLTDSEFPGTHNHPTEDGAILKPCGDMRFCTQYLYPNFEALTSGIFGQASDDCKNM